MNLQVNVPSGSFLRLRGVCRNMALWTTEESCLLLPSSIIMIYLYKIHMHTNCFYIQEATLKDHPRTTSLFIIHTRYNSHASKSRFQRLEYTTEKELQYIPQVLWSHQCSHQHRQVNKLIPSGSRGINWHSLYLLKDSICWVLVNICARNFTFSHLILSTTLWGRYRLLPSFYRRDNWGSEKWLRSHSFLRPGHGAKIWAQTSKSKVKTFITQLCSFWRTQEFTVGDDFPIWSSIATVDL